MIASRARTWTVRLAAAAVGLGAALRAQTRDIEVVRAESTPAVSLRPDDAGEISLGTYHALLVAVQDYAPHHPDLSTPRADAEALADVLVERLCFARENVQVLVDAAASRESILDALDALAERLGRDDNLLVFYAGHGTAQWRFEDWAEGFWIPHGATERWSTWLSSHTLRRALARIRARHVLVISDSCFSGSMNDREVRVDAVPEDIRRFARDPSCQLLASGQWEAVTDTGRDGHSIFAWHLLRLLRGTTDYLTARDLAGGMIGEFRALLRRREVTQMPEWDAELIRQGTSSGQFVFVRDPATRSHESTEASHERLAAHPGLPPGYGLPPHVRAVADAIRARTVGDDAPRRYTFVHDEFGVPVEMVLVPGGTFTHDGSTYEVEPFLIDRFEVTNERIANFKNRAQPTDWPAKEPGHGDAQRPVTNVSLHDARRFASWARKELPTVTQWRWAAGAPERDRGALQRHPWGDRVRPFRRGARFAPAVGSDPEDVATRSGAMDLGRGVAEWCELVPRERTRGAVCGGRTVATIEERLARLAPPCEVTTAESRGAHERELARIGFRCVLPLVSQRR